MSTNSTLYEAESAVNTQYETRIFEKAECSNGKCVGWIGFGRYLQFNNIYADKSDTYGLQISYLVSGERELYFCINDKIYFSKKLSGNSFNKPTSVMIDIPLKAGYNTIKFYNSNDWAPDIDCIRIYDIYMRKIYVDNITDEEIFSYKYLIIKGHVTDVINATSISVALNHENVVEWPVHNTKKTFKAVVNLKEGDNLIEIVYAEHKRKFINIRYERKKEGPGIRFTYMLPKGDVEGRFRAPSGVDNSLQSAKKRYSTMILLAQSYFAEMMYDRGFGRQTFRIIPVNENNPDDFIFVKNATKTFSELCMYNSEQREGEYTYEKLFGYIDSLMTDRMPYYSKDVVMTSCSYYEPYINDEGKWDKYTYVDTALGAVGGNTVLVGATTLYSIPENFEDICTALYDKTEGYMLDNTRWEEFNTAVGGLVHEMGHVFGLDHYYELCDNNGQVIEQAFIDWDTEQLIGMSNIDGIMGWGFYQMNHQISIHEGNGAEFDNASDSACWNWAYTNKINGSFVNEQNDCMVLASNPWISDVPYYKREAESSYNQLIPYNETIPDIYRVRECSGWNCVGCLGAGSSIIFDNIYVEEIGVFSVKIYYMSDETRYVKMKTSYKPDEIRYISFQPMQDWFTVGVTTVNQVYLSKGINQIIFLTDNIASTWAPDIDKIEIIRTSY